MFILSVYYFTVDNNVRYDDRVKYIGHGNDRGDMIGDDGDERIDISVYGGV